MGYYYDSQTGKEVPEENAFEFVMAEIRNDFCLEEEAKNALVEWYFSGGMWRRMEE